MTDPVPLPAGWSIAEIRDRNLNLLSGGHRKTGRGLPDFTKHDATDAQLARGYKVLLRYDPPDTRAGGVTGKPKFRVVVRAGSRKKVARYIDAVIADVSPV